MRLLTGAHLSAPKLVAEFESLLKGNLDLIKFRIYIILRNTSVIFLGLFICGRLTILQGSNITSDQQSKTIEIPNLLLSAVSQSSEHLVFGNPSNASANPNQPGNYLIEKEEYALSYNRDRGIANWVSWHLDETWLGLSSRIGTYFRDNTLPEDWYHAAGTDYSGSGFHRGKMCPVSHRNRRGRHAEATFIMTNIIPLAPDVNNGAWADLARYEKELARQGKELYIIAGGVGALNTIANGRITVPEKIWAVVLVLPNGDNDLSRTSSSTRTIAVIIPNKQGVRSNDWRSFRVNVDAVESLTGFDFFSNLLVQTQKAVESKIDRQ